jgi:RimJ/RimL family protein N-acetyltransferase
MGKRAKVSHDSVGSSDDPVGADCVRTESQLEEPNQSIWWQPKALVYVHAEDDEDEPGNEFLELQDTLRAHLSAYERPVQLRLGVPRFDPVFELQLKNLKKDFPYLDLPMDFSASNGDSALFRFTMAEYWQSRVLHQAIGSAEPIPFPAMQPHKMIMTNGKRHPRRPEKRGQGQQIYARYFNFEGDQTEIALFTASIEEHLDVFSKWHNTDRVNEFWGERGTKEKHRAYLQKQIDDPHVMPVFARWNYTTFAYFEIYWAKEDNIAPFADAQDYDRGFHALVGEQDCRGPHIVPHWIAAVTHYCFLSDPRTMRVMLEPRVDNDKFINYLSASGYTREKDFDFPHKRAALMSITRESFFESHPPAF